MSKGWVWLLALAVACGGTSGGGPLDSGRPDAGSGLPDDAGPGGDAGAPDAGPDAGPPPDAGLPADGGTGTDGGTSGGARIEVPPSGHLYHGVFPAGTSEPDSDISMQAADDYRDAVGRPLAWIYFSN